ncbi:MAG: cation:proton antiporter [Spirulinaceae cyanobacterium]
MTSASLDTTQFNLALLALGGLIYAYSLVSRYVKERLYLSAPILAVILGIVVGPLGWHIFDVQDWGQQDIILEELARLAIAMQLTSTALQLRSAYPFQRWRSLAIFLGPLMLAMWFVSSALVYWLMDVEFWVAVLIGAIITPTDPVLASNIVTGQFAEKHLPENVRNLLSAESGLNDGLAYPFVFLPLLFLRPSTDSEIVHWLGKVWLWDVGVAIIAGLAMGYGAGKLLKWANRKQLMDKQSFLAYALALTLVTLGGIKLMNSDGILGVFMAGVGYDLVVQGSDRADEENVQEALDLILTVVIFVLLGLVIPWQDWLALGWPGIALVITVLLLRRLPAFFLLNRFIPRSNGLKDALFMGWFGPIGVAALYYANLAVHRTGIHEIWAIASLVIVGSVFVHGITAVPLSIWYKKAQPSRPEN